MRYEDDINTALDMKSICCAALLNDNAPDSGLSDTSSSHSGAAIFAHYIYESFSVIGILVNAEALSIVRYEDHIYLCIN